MDFQYILITPGKTLNEISKLFYSQIKIISYIRRIIRIKKG